MNECLFTELLDKSPFTLLTLSVALVGYIRNVPIPLLLRKLKPDDSGKNTTEVEILPDQRRYIHNQLMVLNFLQIVLTLFSFLVIGRLFWGNFLDNWIKCIMLCLVILLLVFHLVVNSRYIWKSVNALIELDAEPLQNSHQHKQQVSQIR